mmetsp:Transcript_34928/g.104531  ORF Transcript_34928/g.104531 Transcript_34928/m.104531 type:complete len:164 (-) Transcript_34928:114-605(-)
MAQRSSILIRRCSSKDSGGSFGDIPRCKSSSSTSGRRLVWMDKGSDGAELPRPVHSASPSQGVPGSPRNENTVSMGRTVSKSNSSNIDDRRLDPCEADHPRILSTFQQGLASVETVIIYDCKHHLENPDHFECLDPPWVRWPRNTFRYLCGNCHSGIVTFLRT